MLGQSIQVKHNDRSQLKNQQIQQLKLPDGKSSAPAFPNPFATIVSKPNALIDSFPHFPIVAKSSPTAFPNPFVGKVSSDKPNPFSDKLSGDKPDLSKISGDRPNPFVTKVSSEHTNPFVTKVSGDFKQYTSTNPFSPFPSEVTPSLSTYSDPLIPTYQNPFTTNATNRPQLQFPNPFVNNNPTPSSSVSTPSVLTGQPTAWLFQNSKPSTADIVSKQDDDECQQQEADQPFQEAEPELQATENMQQPLDQNTQRLFRCCAQKFKKNTGQAIQTVNITILRFKESGTVLVLVRNARTNVLIYQGTCVKKVSQVRQINKQSVGMLLVSERGGKLTRDDCKVKFGNQGETEAFMRIMAGAAKE